MVEAYRSGEKRGAIAAEFGVSDHYPRMLAARRGLPPRSVARGAKGSHSAKPVLAVQT